MIPIQNKQIKQIVENGLKSRFKEELDSELIDYDKDDDFSCNYFYEELSFSIYKVVLRHEFPSKSCRKGKVYFKATSDIVLEPKFEIISFSHQQVELDEYLKDFWKD